MKKGSKKPSKQEVNLWVKKWKENLPVYVLQEKILSNLFRNYPKNTEESEVKIKVKTLNLYYSTNVLATDQMAEHIYKLQIDEKLKKGDLDLVEKIANLNLKNGEKRVFYSFASKYCNFHNSDKYPIYDSIVSDLLYQFNKSHKFYRNGNFTKKELKESENYSQYKEIIDAFRNFFKLKEFGYKDIDRYLWTMGKISKQSK